MSRPHQQFGLKPPNGIVDIMSPFILLAIIIIHAIWIIARSVLIGGKENVTNEFTLGFD